jgi:hypothetical protein
LPVVSIPAEGSRPPESGTSRPPPASPNNGWTGSRAQSNSSGGLAGSPATEPLSWEEIAGATRLEQLKTVLAAVGALAIFVQVLRLLNKREAGAS